MTMNDLFAGSDSEDEVAFKINEDYAKKYNKWRSLELSQHWKDVTIGHSKKKEHDNSEDDGASSSDDSSQSSLEDTENLKNFEKSFLQMMALLKKDDPNKYDKMEEIVSAPDSLPKNSKKKKKDKPFLIRDYERKLIVEKGGKLSDDEEAPETDPRSSSPTYVEEQRALKNNFKQALESSDSEEEKDIGNLFKKKIKTKAETQKEDDEFKAWLKGRKKELKDKETESQLQNLHDYWTDPNIDPDEVFLRDYILANTHLDHSEDEDQPAFSELNGSGDLDADTTNERLISNDDSEKQWTYRFEEGDTEFIKRYPRNVEASFRRKDDRRKRKRQERRERKEAEKEAMREQIKQIKAIKRKEILEKIEKIKKVTGNNDVNIQDVDLEDEFNPEEHDQKMRELFNDDYYQVEEEDKPECPELERELEIENWENWQGNNDEDGQFNEYEAGQPESEAPDFNMDCDYDPRAQLQNELLSMTKSKKKQRRKSRFAAALAREKPVFDPNDKKFEQYFDEYYKLDCEDIIGDLPCRFKYRQTTPNDYGLTVDEILRADVKELNKWCSLKKVVKFKPDYVEKYEVQAYQKKASNEALKRKILPSLYARNEFEDAVNASSEGTKTKNKKRKLQETEDYNEHEIEHNFSDKHMYKNESEDVVNASSEGKKKKNKKKKLQESEGCDEHEIEHNFSDKYMYRNESEDAVNASSEGRKKKKKKKLQESVGNDECEIEHNFSDKTLNSGSVKNFNKRKGKDRCKAESGTSENNTVSDCLQSSVSQKKFKKEKHKNKAYNHQNSVVQKDKSYNHTKKENSTFKKSDFNIPVSDDRLKAYGLHPKKFKNKMKYGKNLN